MKEVSNQSMTGLYKLNKVYVNGIMYTLGGMFNNAQIVSIDGNNEGIFKGEIFITTYDIDHYELKTWKT